MKEGRKKGRVEGRMEESNREGMEGVSTYVMKEGRREGRDNESLRTIDTPLKFY